MKYSLLGKSGIKASVIAYGTGQLVVGCGANR